MATKKCPNCGTVTEMPPFWTYGLCPECNTRVEWEDNGPTNLTEIAI